MNSAVPFTLMPKGVEHGRSVSLVDRGAVPFTLMPKGVEHFAYLVGNSTAPQVPFTLMPKGVEHLRRNSWLYPR